MERLPFRRDDGDSSVYEPRIDFSGEFIGEADCEIRISRSTFKY